MCRQANFIEVGMDTETGEVLVTNVVNVNDVGKAISPETVEGQMNGVRRSPLLSRYVSDYCNDTGIALSNASGKTVSQIIAELKIPP